MALSTWNRWYTRARRTLRRQWFGFRVTFRGNRVTRRTDFQRGVDRPILLLQGFGSTRHALLVLEQRLRADGFEVLSLRLGGLFGTLNTRTIDRVAKDVLAKIAALRARHGMGKIAIVGHSKGGIIARYLVACLGGEAHVDTIVTLGTPHQGMPPAHLARVTRLGSVMPSVRQMRPTSKLFRLLQAAPMPSDVHCVSIQSPDDRVVPSRLARWLAVDGERPPENIEIAGLSHTDYLVKHRVYEVIRDHLALAEVVVAPPASH